MTASELRIGNWVMIEDSEPHPITGIKSDKIYHFYKGHEFHSDLSDARPIPLTPQLLEKAGFRFKKLPENWLNGENGHEICLRESADRWLLISGHFATVYDSGNIFKGMPICAEIRYLHQLQNLYHSLTGSDLSTTL